MEPVEWVSPTGEKPIRNVVINAKIYVEAKCGKLLQRNLRDGRDPLGFSKTVLTKTTFFEDNLENHFLKNQGKQTCQTIKHFNKEDAAKFFW